MSRIVTDQHTLFVCYCLEKDFMATCFMIMCPKYRQVNMSEKQTNGKGFHIKIESDGLILEEKKFDSIGIKQ